jgi:hypothetical protein
VNRAQSETKTAHKTTTKTCTSRSRSWYATGQKPLDARRKKRQERRQAKKRKLDSPSTHPTRRNVPGRESVHGGDTEVLSRVLRNQNNSIQLVQTAKEAQKEAKKEQYEEEQDSHYRAQQEYRKERM